MTKDELYVHMAEELTGTGLSFLDMPSIETFRLIWKSKFPQLKIPRYNTLGTCDVCLKFKLDLGCLRKISPEYGNLNSAFKLHLVTVKNERRQQMMRDQEAADHPMDSWTITTDFMQDFFMPFLACRPKSWYGWVINYYCQVYDEVFGLESIWLHKFCHQQKVCN
jgi:hypothetical protein